MSRTFRLAVFVAGIAALGACSKTAPTYDGGATSTGGSNAGSNGGGTSSGGSANGGTTSNGGSNGGTSGGIGGSQACADYANAECNLFNSCSDGYEISVAYGDLGTCVAAYQAFCNDRLSVPAADTGLTATQIEACAQALPAESCANLYDGDNTSPCLAPQGPLGTGSACALSAECASAFCAIPKDQVCGTCQPQPVAGASCAVTQCTPGLICLSTTQTCEIQVTDGGACGTEDDCQFGFGCPSADGGLHICEPAGGAGAPCDFRNRTGPVCFGRGGFFCEHVGDGGVCTARGLAAAASECGDISGLETVCEQGGVCQKAQRDAGTGTCLAYAPDGTACDTDAGPGCLGLSRCVPTSSPGTAGTCVANASQSCGVFTTGGGSTGGAGGTTGGGTSSGGAGGTSGGGSAGNTIALVDNNGYVNDGSGTDTTELALWRNLLTGAGITAFDVVSINADGSQSWTTSTDGLVPSATQLAKYNTVIWFTADNSNSATGTDWPLSTDQQEALTAWLDLGGKTLVVFSENFVTQYYQSDGAAWTTAASIPFFTSYVPLQGAENDPYFWTGATNGDADSAGTDFTVTGSATVSAGFGALTWDVVEMGSSFLSDNVCVLNPATGTDTLATIQSDPLETNTMNITVAVAAGKKHIGALGTSTAVYVGVPIEEDFLSGGTFSTGQLFFNGVVQTYAGVP